MRRSPRGTCDAGTAVASFALPALGREAAQGSPIGPIAGQMYGASAFPDGGDVHLDGSSTDALAFGPAAPTEGAAAFCRRAGPCAPSGRGPIPRQGRRAPWHNPGVHALPLLEVTGLGKAYGPNVAVRELSFTVGPGEILGLVGPNGAGKTTTLRCLAGILPSSGTVRIAGHPLATAPVEAKRALAFLPDEPRLFDYLTVEEHLELVARLYRVEGWAPRAKALIAELGLAEKAVALPGELSRGMRQKLLVACALLHDPALILLDEPLTGLDPLAIRHMKGLLRARAQAGAALVLSSHLLPLVEELCDRVLVLAAGRCVALGTLAEIRGQFAGAGGDASLEELFVRITSAGGGA